MPRKLRHCIRQPWQAFGSVDEAPTPFYPLSTLYKSLFLLAFVGDFDADAYPTDWDICLLASFIILVVIIMMNVLIAIVSDEYDRCMALAYELYWTERLDQVRETALIYPALPMFLQGKVDGEAVKSVVQEEMTTGTAARQSESR